ncbi:hypothetical protein BS50DRAFT_590006 [Corynespora cassiicola Philippines]|uniref:Impact N-terminal domain-containing protein n=1 Tax=Corynespora cassiicola Philippines TaxID=1448308 RepID=A0A2T2NJL4_CORCC|nr:hypothetical protein BS50DRAFT_590006 [Corynespora cassiicola Philippines]
MIDTNIGHILRACVLTIRTIPDDYWWLEKMKPGFPRCFRPVSEETTTLARMTPRFGLPFSALQSPNLLTPINLRWASPARPTDMALKRERSSSPAPPLDILRSSSVEDQKSVFVAAFSSTLSVKALQGLPEFSTATHRMAAWRKRSRQQSLMPSKKVIYDLGHDDDGEKWAGSRLRNVLNDTSAEGVVVVARWYGGQNIGPIRFTHIENCAKEAIWKWKAADEEAKREQAVKKQRLEEKKSRKELEENLRERDLNIFVLRGLLAEKTAELNDTEKAPPTPQKGPPDYSNMSMEALKRVDKARDATIAFILKGIDKVDEELKSKETFSHSKQNTEKHKDEDTSNAPKDESAKEDKN